MKIGKLICLLSAAVMLYGCASDSSSAQDAGSRPSETSVSVTSAAESAKAESKAASSSGSAADSSSAADPSEEDMPPSLSEPDSSEAEAKPRTDITPLMWEVKSDSGGRLVLLGSIHVMAKEAYPLPECITGALDAADALAVECDVVKAETDYSLQLKEVQAMYYPSGETIDEHISATVLANARAFAKEFGMDLSLYSRCKPWVHISLLDSLVVDATGLRRELGLDRKLLEYAKQKNKEIIEVESAESQVDMQMSFSDTITELQLADYKPEDKDEIIQLTKDHFTAWCKGDYEFFDLQYNPERAGEAAAEVTVPLSVEQINAIEEYNETMYSSRNRLMADKADELLKAGRNVLFVVGEAHFVGSGGIIGLLKSKGYEVTQIQTEQVNK